MMLCREIPQGRGGRQQRHARLRGQPCAFFGGLAGFAADCRDPSRERAQEQRMADRLVGRGQHRDPVVAGLVSVADRAQPHGMAFDARLQPVHCGHHVHHAGGQPGPPRAPASAVVGRGDERIALAFQLADAAFDDLRTVAGGLGPQPHHQVPTCRSGRPTACVPTPWATRAISSHSSPSCRSNGSQQSSAATTRWTATSAGSGRRRRSVLSSGPTGAPPEIQSREFAEVTKRE